jgi:Nitroreductase
METMKTIAIRKSTRKYTDAPVPTEALDAILLAGCAAPVGRGAYDSLHITVINTPEGIAKLLAAYETAGRPGNPTFGAPMLAIVSAKASAMPALDNANAACVAENMIIAATDFGVGTCYVFGPASLIANTPGLAAEFGIPEEFVPAAGVVIGMPEEPLTEERELTLKIGVNYA